MCETMEINTEWRPLTDRKHVWAFSKWQMGRQRSALPSPSRWQHAFHKSLLGLSSNSPRRQVLIIPILLLRKLKPGEGRWFNKVTQGGPERGETLAPIPWSSVHCWAEDTSQAEGHPGLPWVSRGPELQHPSISSWTRYIQIQALNPQKNSH